MRGYAMAEVDLCLDRLSDELARLGDGLPPTLDPAEIARIAFPTAVRGYDQAQIDRLLRLIAAEADRLGGRH